MSVSVASGEGPFCRVTGQTSACIRCSPLNGLALCVTNVGTADTVSTGCSDVLYWKGGKFAVEVAVSPVVVVAAG